MPVPRKPKAAYGTTDSAILRTTKCHYCGVHLLKPLRESRRPCGVLQKCAACDFAVCAEDLFRRGTRCPICGGTSWVAIDASALKRQPGGQRP